MMNEPINKNLCHQFSVLLSYPVSGLQNTAIMCRDSLARISPDAACQLHEFIDFVDTADRAQIEEIYTSTFDLQPVCHPYVGYQLCGENQKRAMFLMKMQQIYRHYDYTPGNELPDHLCEILRFISRTNAPDCCQELIDDGVLPALEKIIQAIENDDHPYKRLLMTLQCFLSESRTENGALL
ncbi:respiratory nitrate reductase chaperone NarJ [Desulfuromusa kysingii]|uniref:Respiratory nitrate reductase chaperone NarJ n=1 Tax=Desulfuromusa kysingii TaxID=37625 RepID=A0A1H4DPV1_9BACT|nr:molecular chaperone TorD family protein [Desulfuromusa kysingii]SEA74795.1 respiratory nitrate reductase chaperone NarJ [Desulfuromusa kysingii]